VDKGFSVSFEGDYVRVDSYGERSLDYARALWGDVTELCEEHNCYKVLGVSNAPGPMPTGDGYEHAGLFVELGLTGKYKIAWAELNDEARKATRFVEDVLFNRGLPGKAFRDEAEARAWLFSDDT